MNKQLLRSIIVLNQDTYATLAKYLDISERSFASKINEDGTEFKQSEISKIKEKYSLSDEEVVNIFFS
jgi:hypothetical protein